MDELLSRPNITMERLVKHPDIQYEYRTKNKRLLKVIMEEGSILYLINTFQTSLDKIILKRILGLFISPNTLIISEIGQDIKLTTSFLSVLSNPVSYHRFILSSICNIFIKIIEMQPQQAFKNIYNSSEILFWIMQSLNFPAVFQLAAKFILSGDNALSFGWLLLKTLLDDHGLGCSIPSKVSRLPVFNSNMPVSFNKLYREQRIRAIELLTLLFTQPFTQSFELFSAASNALPLLLQDAGDDKERSTVFKLGLSLRPSAALGYSAVSVINSLTCEDILIVAALQYITRFDVLVGPRSLELFVYRILHRKSVNNFIMLSTANVVAKSVKLQKNKELQNNLRDLLVRCFKVDGLSLLTRSFKAIFLEASNGVEIDPLSKNGFNKVKQARTSNERSNPEIEDRIREYRVKARSIDEGRSTITPIYDAVTLWREEAKNIASNYKRVDKLNISKPFPSKSPVSSPKPKTPRVKRFIPEFSDSSSDDEPDFFLEEIDVTEKYQQIEFREVKDNKEEPQKDLPPLTKQESIKEPIPSSPVRIEDTLMSNLTRVITPRSLKLEEPMDGDDDITLDVPARPPKIVLESSDSEEEETEEMEKNIREQLALLDLARKGRIRLEKSKLTSYEFIE